jgi:hypothetical protein
VFFENSDGDAGAGEEEAEHHACRASADDAAGGGVRMGGGGHLVVERSKRVGVRQKEFLNWIEQRGVGRARFNASLMRSENCYACAFLCFCCRSGWGS